MSEKTGYPKKYWWLVVFVLPVILAFVQFVLPIIIKKPEPSSMSGKMTIINEINIGKEIEKYQGRPLKDEELKQQIDRAVAAAMQGEHDKSSKTLKEIPRAWEKFTLWKAALRWVAVVIQSSTS